MYSVTLTSAAMFNPSWLLICSFWATPCQSGLLKALLLLGVTRVQEWTSCYILETWHEPSVLVAEKPDPSTTTCMIGSQPVRASESVQLLFGWSLNASWIPVHNTLSIFLMSSWSGITVSHSLTTNSESADIIHLFADILFTAITPIWMVASWSAQAWWNVLLCKATYTKVILGSIQSNMFWHLPPTFRWRTSGLPQYWSAGRMVICPQY